MADTHITLTGKLAEQIIAAAEQQNISVEALLSTWLVNMPPASEADNWALRMAQMAEADTDIDWNDSAAELSGRSREILDQAFGQQQTSQFESKM